MISNKMRPSLQTLKEVQQSKFYKSELSKSTIPLNKGSTASLLGISFGNILFKSPTIKIDGDTESASFVPSKKSTQPYGRLILNSNII